MDLLHGFAVEGGPDERQGPYRRVGGNEGHPVRQLPGVADLDDCDALPGLIVVWGQDLDAVLLLVTTLFACFLGEPLAPRGGISFCSQNSRYFISDSLRSRTREVIILCLRSKDKV